MSKILKLQMLLFSFFVFLILPLSHIFKNELTDFTLGFCEGISCVFIIIWSIYLVYCIIKRKTHTIFKIY